MSYKDKVKLVIMSSGEHIIGYVTAEYEDSIVIENPVSLVPDPAGDGRRMIFIPYLQFSKEDAALFPRRDIRHILDPDDGITDNYDSKFGAGIIMAAVPPGGTILS